MKITFLRTAALASLLLASVAPALAATHTAPKAIPTPAAGKKPLHSEFVAEVNKLGQVVRIESGKSSKDKNFDFITYGNVMQMWIRRPDGSAEVGLFRVSFDYSPKTGKTDRNVSLVKPGGDWGDKEGAATQMVDIAHKESQQQLESLEKILGTSPAPSSMP